MNNFHFKFLHGIVGVLIGDQYYECLEQEKIKQQWESQFQGVPRSGKRYIMPLKGMFKIWECTDADCPLTGCKHSSCYKASFVSL